MTSQEFVDKHGIEIRSEKVMSNPNMKEDPRHPMDHWQCRLFLNTEGKGMGKDDPRNRFYFFFSKGMGLRRKSRFPNIQGTEEIPVSPTISETLDCLRLDSQSVIDTDFPEWAEEFGYENIREAYDTWQVCKRQERKLRDFLCYVTPKGMPSLWNEFLETEEGE